MAEAADLQTGLVPHRKAEGAERALHTLGPQPFLGMRDERLEDRLVLRFHHTPIAGARAHALRGGLAEREKLGRAVSRERVCQYGESSGADVSLTKKQNINQ